ncbi:uncharacterized protein PHALS_07888 [Plasmopara halstedii]|uniref:RxLR-like protein n=1 Tax=Plasmopara halstedii TaxID=4781 RepID=A0A0N7L8K9_PLAHL|nr:uncharacterized protein PHALS_07888 [Plasmopara halstedii]CEG50163.1 hypothetical protein PHALS_07888 [Plasmopara halstedii]|eukprot:XP_024586532.1 hypothetical protein PHALS_07888 [Plasmopara halstedii]
MLSSRCSLWVTIVATHTSILQCAYTIAPDKWLAITTSDSLHAKRVVVPS